MPLDWGADFVAVDEIQLCADPDRGHVFTDRLLRARGRRETLFLGAETIRPRIAQLLPEARITATKTRAFASARPTEREFERWLTRDAGLTRSEARALMRSGLSGLKALRDAGEGLTEDARLAAQMRQAARTLLKH